MEIIDNIHKTFKDDLLSELNRGSKLSVAASCFSIYAFQELKEQLKNIETLRFIFTFPSFVTDQADKQKREFFIPRLNRERSLYGSEFEVRLRNELTQKAIAKECAEWIKQKVCFKSNRTGENMMGFAVVNDQAYMPINGFTTVELGCERGDNAYTMITKIGSPHSQQYMALFEQIWNDKSKLEDVTDEVVEKISNVYKENAPEFLYFVTLYNIFHEFLEDISEDVLPNEATGFKNSVIWNKLYNFQRDAALGVINKLEKYNGCILADSVGLGKTFTALSVIKYYESRNRNVLVLCPKKLNDNWMTFRSNYKNNPLAADRLRYDVAFHTDLSRESGFSNGNDLAKMNWNNYDLVVIDESHNFRNGGKVTGADEENPRENRYLRLMNRVICSGVKTKVLMLSATPVNNRFNDLKNQLQLAYEGDSKHIDHLLNTSRNIDDIFRQAQTAYNRWTRYPVEQRTTAQLLKELSFDFFEVLDAVTIARSRRHVEKFYDTAEIGQFPERLKPISRRPALTDLDQAITYNEIYELINKLNLAVYTPSDFILPSQREKYFSTDGDALTFAGQGMAGREKGIRRLMSINLLKRLESSVNSFRLTLSRIEALIASICEQIEKGGNGTHANTCVDDYAFSSDLEMDDQDADVFIGNKKSKILLQDMDYIAWDHYLQADLETLRLLQLMLSDITPAHDTKLQQLIADLHNKFARPINEGNKKAIIFTAFSDTASYLYDNLAPLIREKDGLHTALVTGDIEAKSTLKTRQKLDFNTVLTLFSPQSKDKATLYPDTDGEIDILIGTDCISEGQNLQDCDYLINYDIHWNPVRIIQRFGRIDRIGSRNKVIQLVNYWPDMTLDDYINLKERVEARMKVSVLTSTGDDNLISDEEKGDLEYRRTQLKRLQEEVVDLEEMNTGISIMDLGLNEFRLDLLAYMKENHDVEHTPFGLQAVVPSGVDTPPGVIFILKNRSNGVNINHKNRLHPFYMVYVAADGSIVTNHLAPKDLLDKMRFVCKGQTKPLLDLCQQFNHETRNGKSMKRYSDLLTKAIQSIVEVKAESDIDAFLSGDQGNLFADEIRGLDDFELICFLVIQ